MIYTRVFTGMDNQSHFEDVDIPLSDALIGQLSAPIVVNQLVFGEIADVEKVDWHNPPWRQFIMMLQGSMEIEIGDGCKRTFHPGDVVLLEDTTGQGHITRPDSENTRRYMMIRLATE